MRITERLNKMIKCAAVTLVTATLILSSGAVINADIEQPSLQIPRLEDIHYASYCVYDKTADKIVISDNEDGQIYPASMTKIMTGSLALDYLDTEAFLTCSQNAIDGISYDSTTMGLCVGESTTVSELMYGLLLPSGNDAANVLGEGVVEALIQKYPADSDRVGPDGVNASYLEEQLGLTSQEILDGYRLTAFAVLMNLRAQNWGCTGTHFVNAHGLHDDNHYTTARDLTTMLSHACENPDFVKVIHSPTHIFASTNIHIEDGWSIVTNSNKILSDPWLVTRTYEAEDTHCVAVMGGKTGSTSTAGTGMTIYTVNENGHELFAAVCGIPYDYYAYQTRYVASVTAYGNLACWESDPVTRILGTTDDYRGTNTTNSQIAQYDPFMVPGDDLQVFIDANNGEEVPEPTDVMDIINPTDESGNPVISIETGSDAPNDNGVVPLGNDTKEMPAWLVWVADNLVVSIVIAVLTMLIMSCIIALIIRTINVNRHRRKHKTRPYKGDTFKADSFKDVRGKNK